MNEETIAIYFWTFFIAIIIVGMMLDFVGCTEIDNAAIKRCNERGWTDCNVTEASAYHHKAYEDAHLNNTNISKIFDCKNITYRYKNGTNETICEYRENIYWS
jgi:hypothetical protein